MFLSSNTLTFTLFPTVHSYVIPTPIFHLQRDVMLQHWQRPWQVLEVERWWSSQHPTRWSSFHIKRLNKQHIWATLVLRWLSFFQYNCFLVLSLATWQPQCDIYLWAEAEMKTHAAASACYVTHALEIQTAEESAMPRWCLTERTFSFWHRHESMLN